jgi:hypothetical protein
MKDIDRPVVVVGVYKGRSQRDAQDKALVGGPRGATGNAPAWLAGNAAGHGHAHIKSPSLDTSTTSMGEDKAQMLDGHARAVAPAAGHDASVKPVLIGPPRATEQQPALGFARPRAGIGHASATRVARRLEHAPAGRSTSVR